MFCYKIWRTRVCNSQWCVKRFRYLGENINVKEVLKLRKIVFFVVLMLLSVGFITALAETNVPEYTVKIDGNVVTSLSAGEVTVDISVDLDESLSAVIFGAVYTEDAMDDVTVTYREFNTGNNAFSISGLTATSESTDLKIMIWDISDGALFSVVYSSEIFDDTNTPSITDFKITLTGSRTVTYNGLINEEAKTIDLDIPVYYNNNGNTIETAANSNYLSYCPLTAVEYSSAVKSLSPTVTCSEGAWIIGGTENLDFTNPRSITVVDNNGKYKEYKVTISADTMQRWINLSNSSLSLTNPTSTFGATTLERHGTPTSSGTLMGSGYWTQTGFEWKTDAAGNYLDAAGNIIDTQNSNITSLGPDDESGFVRGNTIGYFRVVNNTGLRMKNDKLGEFSLSSTAGGSPNYWIKRTFVETKLRIEEIIGGSGFEIAFSKGRFVMRAVPSNDNKAVLWFGTGVDTDFSGLNTGIEINIGQDYTIQCITENNEDGTATGKLYLDGVGIANQTITPTEGNRTNPYHTRFSPCSDSKCSVLIYNWKLSYITDNTLPETIETVYNGVVQEERAIWNWIAEMYDGSGTVYYGSEINTANLKYDSMNYLTGGSGNGFFYAPSAKSNPTTFCAEIESTGQVLSNMSNVGLLKYMPQNIRDRFYQYFASRYVDEDSYTAYGIDASQFNLLGEGYYDTLYMNTVNSRGHSRNQSNAANIKRVDSNVLTNSYLTSSQAVIGPVPSAQDPTVPNSLAMLSSYESNANELLIAPVGDETISAYTSASSSEYVWGTQENDSQSNNLIPAIKESPAAFKNWVTYLNWSSHSWTAGDRLSNAPTYIEMYGDLIVANGYTKDEYYQAALDVLIEKQDPDIGVWPVGGGVSSSNPNLHDFPVEISGVFKVCIFINKVPSNVLNTYQPWLNAGCNAEICVPNAQKLYDYIIKNLMYYAHRMDQTTYNKYYTEDEYTNIVGSNFTAVIPTNSLQIRNTLDVIMNIRDIVNGQKLEDDLEFIIEFSYNHMLMYRINGVSGVYSSSVTYDANDQVNGWNSAGSTGMGNSQSLGGSEACINTSNNITKLYTVISTFYNKARPQFDAEYAYNFYQKIQDELDAYVIKDDFESYAVGSEPTLNSFTLSSSTNASAGTQTMVQKDGHTGKALVFTYDGTATSGPNIKFKVGSTIAPETAVMTFDMKIPTGYNSNPNLIHFGFSGEALFSVKRQSNTEFALVNRTSDTVSTVQLGDSMSAGVWYKIRIEYTPEAETNKIHLYVDDSLIYSGNDVYTNSDGMFSECAITMYKATYASVYIDNMSVYVTE